MLRSIVIFVCGLALGAYLGSSIGEHVRAGSYVKNRSNDGKEHVRWIVNIVR